MRDTQAVSTRSTPQKTISKSCKSVQMSSDGRAWRTAVTVSPTLYEVDARERESSTPPRSIF